MQLFNSHRRFLAVLLTLACFGATGPAIASSDDERIMRIDFPGGTVAEYIAHLRELRPDANIVLMPDAAKVSLPPITLSTLADELHTTIQILEHITDASTEPNIAIVWDGIIYLVRLQSPRALERTGRSAVDYHVNSYSLASVIVPNHISAKDVLSNIEIAIGMIDTGENLPDMRFHEQTNLLIVGGRMDQHRAISNTLSSMKQTAEEVRERRADAWIRTRAEHAEHLESWLKQMQDEFAKRDELIERLIAEVRELRTKVLELEQRGRQ
jgi:hypothetical protein